MTAAALEVRDLGIVFDTRRGPLQAIEGISFAMAGARSLASWVSRVPENH